MFEVLFFEDARTAKMYESQVKHFIAGFKLKDIANKVKSNAKVNAAARTAMIHYFFLNGLHHNI